MTQTGYGVAWRDHTPYRHRVNYGETNGPPRSRCGKLMHTYIRDLPDFMHSFPGAVPCPQC